MDWLLYSKNNQEMVDKFTRLGIIESSEVEKAFRCVSRAAFVPEDLIDDAFRDKPLRGSHQVHMSAPHMYASILEELELDAGMSFLNVGSGTGYFSTLAGYILKKEGINHGIELHEELVRFANEKIQNFLENGPSDAKDICKPIMIAGNCCRLDTEQAKYDRLYCGASCTQANVKFLLELVKVGGFLIAPVGSRLIKLKRVSLKEGRQSVINDVSFAPLIAPTAEDKKLPKLRFPEQCRKKKKQNSIICDVSFPVCKSPARKLLAQLRSFQSAIDCLENGTPLPMPFCYVPSFDDMNKAKGKQSRSVATTTTATTTTTSNGGNHDHIAVDSQIDFFVDSLKNDQEHSGSRSNSIDVIDKSNHDSKKSQIKSEVDWENISTDKIWLKILEHYYSLCATTESRKKECFKLKMENSGLPVEQFKILTFKKYAKKMGLIPSKSKASKCEVKESKPKVEEVASGIVDNLLEEVISQVDESRTAENFIAAITNHETFRRRSSAARAIILDNLPRLRACSQENNAVLQQLLCNTENEADNNASKPSESYLSNMESTVYRMIDDIDKQILSDISLDHMELEEDSVPSIADDEYTMKDKSETGSNANQESSIVDDQFASHATNQACLSSASDTTAYMKNGEFVAFVSDNDVDISAEQSRNINDELKQRLSSFFEDNNVHRSSIQTQGENTSTELNTSSLRFNDFVSFSSHAFSDPQNSNEHTPCKFDPEKYKLFHDSCVSTQLVSEGENGGLSRMADSQNSFVICDGNTTGDSTENVMVTDEGNEGQHHDDGICKQDQCQSIPASSTPKIEEKSSTNKHSSNDFHPFLPKEKNDCFKTSYSSTFKKKKKFRKKFTDIKMDVASSEMLHALPGASWDIKHDKELVLFLARKEKSTGHVAFSPCCSNIIKPQHFTNIDLVQYKRICAYPATSLAARAITLKRVGKLLDAVMNSLVGPSLSRDQMKTLQKSEYPLESFTDSSFESSGMKLSKVNDDIANEISQQQSDVSTKIDSDGKGNIESINKLMQQEIENVNRESKSLLTKMDLYEKLNEQYEIQKQLIKKQIEMIKEKEQLLQTQIRSGISSHDQNNLQVQKKLNERKRKELAQRLEEIENDQLSKNAEQKSLIQMYNQLDGLLSKFIKERNEVIRMGRDYFAKDAAELENFVKLFAMSKQLICAGSNDEIENGESAVRNEESKNDDTEKKSITKNRYHPHLLLSKCRFLFPLTSKRLSIVKELLRTSESYSNHPCYVARIDRRIPLKDRHKYLPSNTVFMQLYNSLKNKELNYRDAKRNFEKLWEVKFLGEGIIDQGGGFRDSLAEIADELCPASAAIKPCLQLFIKSPNQRNEVGDHRDAYIPNPSCKDTHLYIWIGKLMGTAFRTDETIPLAFPPFIWKLLVGDHVSWASDYIGVDETIVRITDGTELLDDSTYQTIHEKEQFYMTYLSDGTEKSLIENGADIHVKVDERKEWANLVRKARMLESSKQVEAVRLGLTAVVPESILSCLTWQDLERSICGTPEITVSDLKANCRYYELDLSPNDDRVVYLWEAISSFSAEERSRFIRFVTGRKRLPSPFFLSRSSSDEDNLPTASTCGSNLFLPNYTSASVAAEKIRYAINNCVSIDTDTSPW